MANTKQRCWPGYEPVPGKRPYSQGSCRPKAASKLTPSERTFRAKRKKQLDRWFEQHPKSRRSAAQHLHEAGETGGTSRSTTRRKRSRATASTKRSSTATARAATPRKRSGKATNRARPATGAVLDRQRGSRA